jgi:3-hydroxyisobutyrate dehydrogenase
MAANLHAAGFHLVACDASPSARAALAERVGSCAASSLTFAPTPGALAAATPGGLAAVFTSLPSVAAVRTVWLGEHGLLAGPEPPPAPVLVDLSTSGPATAAALAAAAAAHPARPATLDAPVSGGVTAAAAGTLTFLVGGGPDAAVDAVSPFLAAMGAATLRVGPQPGAGQAAKLANNLALAVQMAGLCEALAFGCAALPGLDPARLLAALNASSGRCWSGVAYPPLPGARAEKGGGAVPATDGRYTGGFAARLMLKDLDLAAGAAAAAGGAVAGAGVPGGAATPPAASASASATLASLPMATAARALYARLAAEKGEDIDFSGLYPFVYGGLGVGGGGGGR